MERAGKVEQERPSERYWKICLHIITVKSSSQGVCCDRAVVAPLPGAGGEGWGWVLVLRARCGAAPVLQHTDRCQASLPQWGWQHLALSVQSRAGEHWCGLGCSSTTWNPLLMRAGECFHTPGAARQRFVSAQRNTVLPARERLCACPAPCAGSGRAAELTPCTLISMCCFVAARGLEQQEGEREAGREQPDEKGAVRAFLGAPLRLSGDACFFIPSEPGSVPTGALRDLSQHSRPRAARPARTWLDEVQQPHGKRRGNLLEAALHRCARLEERRCCQGPREQRGEEEGSRPTKTRSAPLAYAGGPARARRLAAGSAGGAAPLLSWLRCGVCPGEAGCKFPLGKEGEKGKGREDGSEGRGLAPGRRRRP